MNFSHPTAIFREDSRAFEGKEFGLGDPEVVQEN